MFKLGKLGTSFQPVTNPMFWGLYRVLLVQLCFTIFQLTYNIFRNIKWRVTGTYWKLGSSQYEQSAHVQRILMRNKFDTARKPKNHLENFITCHDSFEEPEYVLNDEVSLYAMTDTFAIFVEVPQDKEEIWRGQHGAFSREAQYQHAFRVITLPHHSFLRLTDRLGDTRSRVMIIPNTGRCGSTLMCRVFEETGVCVSWSEPEGLHNIIKLVLDNIITDKAVGRRLVRAVIRMYCKPVLSWGNQQPVGYCLKLMSFATAGAVLLHELYPEYKQLFMYRHGEKVMRSFSSFFEVVPLFKLVTLMMSLHPRLTKRVVQQFGCPENEMGKMNFKLNYCAGEVGVVSWSSAIRLYVGCWEKIKMKAAKYEDLVKDPNYSIEQIFHFFDLPETLIKPAMAAFGKDSQAKSSISRHALNKLRIEAPLHPENVECMNRLCTLFGVPNWRHDFVLPDTITHRPVEGDPLYISKQELMKTFNNAQW